jgi:hypothetical protein
VILSSSYFTTSPIKAFAMMHTETCDGKFREKYLRGLSSARAMEYFTFTELEAL